MMKMEKFKQNELSTEELNGVNGGFFLGPAGNAAAFAIFGTIFRQALISGLTAGVGALFTSVGTQIGTQITNSLTPKAK